jgi:hypothetical protein
MFSKKKNKKKVKKSKMMNNENKKKREREEGKFDIFIVKKVGFCEMKEVDEISEMNKINEILEFNKNQGKRICLESPTFDFFGCINKLSENTLANKEKDDIDGEKKEAKAVRYLSKLTEKEGTKKVSSLLVQKLGRQTAVNIMIYLNAVKVEGIVKYIMKYPSDLKGMLHANPKLRPLLNAHLNKHPVYIIRN